MSDSKNRSNFIDFKPVGGIARLQDPNDCNVVQLLFRVRVSDLRGSVIPKDPNPRDQKITTNVAKKIAETTMDEDNRWLHIFNRGLLCVAKAAEELEDGTVRVYVPNNNPAIKYGLADGATTYEVMMDLLRQEVESDVFDRKFVTIEVIANLPMNEPGLGTELLTGLVSARNTSVQVSAESIQDHKGTYDFVKEALSCTPYNDKIAYRANAPGVVGIKDVVQMLLFMNPKIDPTEKNGDVRICHGPNIYGQNNALRLFENNLASCKKFSNILPEVLELHDYIGATLAPLYNSGYKKKVKAGSLDLFAEFTPYNTSTTPFTEESPKGMVNPQFPCKALWLGCLHPLRELIVEGKDGFFAWKGGLDAIKLAFARAAPRMVAKARELNEEMGRDVDYLGRTYAFWEMLYTTFRLEQMNAAA